MLEALFTPRVIAVFGASATPGKVGYELVSNLLASGFEGEILPINPKLDEVLGLPCRHTLRGVDKTIDLALVAVPPGAVHQAVEDAVDAGAGAVVVITAGFKEVGAEGARRERELVELCKARGARLMGPNCVGLLNAQHKMNATFAPQRPPAGNIAVISQSGALCVAILDWAMEEGVGLGKVVSFGNKADLGEVDFLEALAADPDTRVIVGYLESIDDGDAFLAAAEQAASQKPVVVLKVGVTAAGAKAASSHTGSLAGADIAYGAAFRRSGVIRAAGFEALFDHALAFATQPLPAGRRLAVITNAGGPGIMAADAAEGAGLDLVSLSSATLDRLGKILPPTAALGNPIDVIGDADPDRYLAAFEAVQDDPGIDAILVLATPQNMTRPLELAERLAAAWRRDRPLLFALLGGSEVRLARRRLLELGAACFPAPERAIKALAAMVDYATWRRRPPRVVTRFPVNHRRVERVLTWHRRMGRRRIAEVEAKKILRAYDFRVLDGALAESADGAVEIATRIGYPVVMKIVAPDIVHKSDFGGVKLNLATPEAVRDAYDLMRLRTARRAPEAEVRGVYVEKMGHRGREVILGMTRDPQFGPMLMFGLGGIFVEVMKDVAFHLAPITSEEALEMLQGTRSYALLQGARGQAPVDLETIAAGIQRISQLATDYPQITELDINPFIVGEVGREAYVADARMSLAGPKTALG